MNKQIWSTWDLIKTVVICLAIGFVIGVFVGYDIGFDTIPPKPFKPMIG